MDEALGKAFAHPLRVEIFKRLGEHPGSARLLSEELGHPLSNVAYHFRRLDDLGLIRLVNKVKRRGATEKIYKATQIAPVDSFARKLVPASVRGHVSAPILQAMFDSGTTALKAGTLDARDDSHLVCMPVVLDLDGWKEVSTIMDGALARIAKARVQSAKRLGRTQGQDIRATIIVASFESP